MQQKDPNAVDAVSVVLVICTTKMWLHSKQSIFFSLLCYRDVAFLSICQP